MEYNLISKVESCYIQLPSLLYYSHWPSIFASLFFGFFVFFRSGRSLLGKILLMMSVSFSLWAILNLIVWITVDSRIYSFFWSFFEILSVSFYFLSLYFGYVFIEEKDVSLKIKLFFLIIFFPIVIISFTKYYLFGFDAISCGPIMNDYYLYYVYFLKGLIFLGVLILLFSKYIKYRKDEARKIKIIIGGAGLIILLSSFLITQYFGDFISVYMYDMEFYGLFAIDIFIGFLAYMIVKYKAFNIKLIGAQALIVSLIILIGSQFAFIQSKTNMVLNGITFILVCLFGWFLIKSVKAEVERKEQLQLMSDKLAIANDKLRKLDNAKTEFISIASHQLRTPLTAVKGYVSLILEGSYGPVTQEQKNVLSNISTSNERLINLVEDLLNISRIESGRMEFNFAPCNIADLCREIYDTFVLRAKDRNLSLKLDLTKALDIQLTTDRNKLREVVSNLVDNAIKYTPSGGVIMRALRKEDKVRVEITDTGIGIPDTEMPYLFAKFSRGKDTSRLNAGGTGLGLHVGKSMIEALSGKIWAESEGDKKGSTFIVELPIEHKEE